jgi:hypothetical protein
MARTLVIKSVASAEAINKGLKEIGVSVDESRPETWKYYLNLAGIYHEVDEPMVVTSLDTLEEIEFNRENLSVHTATKRQYAYGSRFYNELVSRFPEQESLILGILNPVELSKSIPAKDGQILYIDQSLIESNEENLVSELQFRIDAFLTRWNLAEYNYVDDLTAASLLAILYMNIPKFILNIRLENCHTEYVHSFHIRQFLASNGRLDSYIDDLTKKQMLFLYRNIRYIHRNAGKQDTFEWLVQNILTDRGLPLAEYGLRHNLTHLPEELRPDIDMVRSGVNTLYSPGTTETSTVEEIHLKQIGLAKDNQKVLDQEIVSTETKMVNSIISKLKTKVLESSILDRTDSEPFPLIDVLLNYWIFLSATDRYSVYLFIDNPKTGDTLQLTPKDAFILYLYSYNMTRGIELPYVPTVWACRVRKDKIPTVPELRSIVNGRYITTGLIQAVLENAPVVKPVISVDAFYDQCTRLYEAQNIHRNIYATQEHYVARGQAEALVGHLYQDIECNLADEMDYLQWLEIKGIDVEGLSKAEFEILTFNILQEATGLSGNQSKTLKQIQSSMLKLMTQLSSYSIHFLQEINNGPVTVLDNPVVRLGDDGVLVHDKEAINFLNTRVKNVDTFGRGAIEKGTVLKTVEWDVDTVLKHSVPYNPSLEWTSGGRIRLFAQGEVPNVQFRQPKEIPSNLGELLTTTEYVDYRYPE